MVVRVICIVALSFVFASRSVVNTFLLAVPGVEYAYNPSVVKEKGGGYRLFYRVDGSVMHDRMGSKFYDSKIGSVLLDKKFTPQGVGRNVKGLPPTAEDPRAVRLGEETVLTYSGLLDCKYYARGIFHCVVDGENRVSQPKLCDLRVRMVEKNWIPFVHNESLYFVYHFAPYKILRDDLTNLQMSISEGYLSQEWSQEWGEMRGGTTLEKYEGEYLSFFHSMTCKKGKYTYHFGAMIHEGSPPFRIKAISSRPISFASLYHAKRSPTADRKKDVIYPSGLVIRRQKAYVFCGENDSAIRVVVIDIPQLKKEMKKVR